MKINFLNNFKIDFWCDIDLRRFGAVLNWIYLVLLIHGLVPGCCFLSCN